MLANSKKAQRLRLCAAKQQRNSLTPRAAAVGAGGLASKVRRISAIISSSTAPEQFFRT
jgi:hypothetical protein